MPKTKGPGRPRLKADQKRQSFLKVGTTKDERVELQRKAVEAGYATVASYLREKGLAS